MDVIYKIKNTKFVRAMLKPIIDNKRKFDLEEYKHSQDSLKIKELKNIHQGKRCFFVGNGPSLRCDDLEKLKGEYTFASNRIYEIFDKTNWRPTYYLAVDDDFIVHNISHIKSISSKIAFLALDKGVSIQNAACDVIRIFEYTKFKINKWNDMTAHISEDVSEYFSVGYTVAFTAIQLAIYMGFKEIYLLGVDFNYSVIRDRNGRKISIENVNDYFSGKTYNSTVLNYYSTLNAYEQASKYADKNNILIKNATRGGKLEVFKRVDFDSLFD